MPTRRLLDEDADLGGQLSGDAAEAARRSLVVETVVVEPGPWRLEGIMTSTPGHLGLLVLEGLVMRTATVDGRSAVDLLDRGDVLRPWDPLDDHTGLLVIETSWTVLAQLRLAVLDRRFATAVARWPEVMESLLTRSLRHSRWLATLLAVNARPRVDERLAMLFRHLAARFGRVTPDGVVIELPLTQERLGQLVAAQRPSISAALGQLAEAGVLQRLPGRGWMLTEPRET